MVKPACHSTIRKCRSEARSGKKCKTISKINTAKKIVLGIKDVAAKAGVRPVD
jgi:hypothetical protein